MSFKVNGLVVRVMNYINLIKYIEDNIIDVLTSHKIGKERV